MKRHYIIYAGLVAIIGAAVIFGVYKNGEAKEYEHSIRMDYQRSFTELVQYVDDLALNLEKSLFVNDAKQMMLLSGEIYRQAAQANANLGLLPLKTQPLENLSEFLSQVGNFSYSLSLKMLDGNEVSQEEYTKLSELCDYAKILALTLDGNLEDLYNGRLDIRRAASEAKDSGIDIAMGEVEDQLHDYPALIYDGPFSSHLTDREPLFIRNMAEITEAEAINKAKSLMGKNLNFECVSEEGNIPCFYLTAKDSGVNYSVAVTKQGGYVMYYLSDREFGDKTIDIAEAKIQGIAFLEAAGYMGMEENYYETTGDLAVINYAPKQDGYTLYPDLIKIKVALDTGEIVGCEARGYIMYHQKRNIPQIKITAEAATEKISPHVEVLSISQAVIPHDSGNEAFTWQIEGRIKNRRCLIYINTQTGAEEKIFLLIESDTGVLAV